jgi:hypothetical protein
MLETGKSTLSFIRSSNCNCTVKYYSTHQYNILKYMAIYYIKLYTNILCYSLNWYSTLHVISGHYIKQYISVKFTL